MIETEDREGDLPFVVHIRGQVRIVKACMFENGLTVSQAIEAAGGPIQFAATNLTFLWRGGNPQEIDLNTPAGKAVVMKPYDTIEVPYRDPAVEEGAEQDDREGARALIFTQSPGKTSNQCRDAFHK